MFARRLFLGAAIVAFASTAPATAWSQTLELTVKKPHLFGASHGTLVFGESDLEYRTPDKDDARKWRYVDLKQVQVLSPTHIALKTYEDQGFLKLWTDRTVEFRVERGTVTPAAVTFLLARIPRPVLSVVLPAETAAPRFRVPVKLAKTGRGSGGDLLLYPDALVYASTRPGESRYWRFADLAWVLAMDRYRLEVVAHEGGAGETRAFHFQLKSDLPVGFYDTLWAALNSPSAPGTQPAGQTGAK